MSEVKMKSVSVQWSQTVYYVTKMEVPADYEYDDIVDAFYELDNSGADPVDFDDFYINDIVELK